MENKSYAHVCDTLDRCRQLARKFSQLRDEVDGLLLAGTKTIASYKASEGHATGLTGDPVSEYVERIETRQDALQSVWEAFRKADWEAREIIKALPVREWEREVLSTYYRYPDSEVMLADLQDVEGCPPILTLTQLERVRSRIMQRVRRARK